jgi:inner membrane protein
VPSPIGHALGGAAAGLLFAPLLPTTRARVVQVVAFAALGAAPDLDLLIGRHRLESHSVGLAAGVAALAMLMRWPLARSRLLTGAAVFAAWFSHPVLDALGTDTSTPKGITMWWPFSSAYVYTYAEVFLPISRRWHLSRTYSMNTLAAIRELLILGPLVGVTLWIAAVRGGRAATRT